MADEGQSSPKARSRPTRKSAIAARTLISHELAGGDTAGSDFEYGDYDLISDQYVSHASNVEYDDIGGYGIAMVGDEFLPEPPKRGRPSRKTKRIQPQDGLYENAGNLSTTTTTPTKRKRGKNAGGKKSKDAIPKGKTPWFTAPHYPYGRSVSTTHLPGRPPHIEKAPRLHANPERAQFEAEKLSALVQQAATGASVPPEKTPNMPKTEENKEGGPEMNHLSSIAASVLESVVNPITESNGAGGFGDVPELASLRPILVPPATNLAVVDLEAAQKKKEERDERREGLRRDIG